MPLFRKKPVVIEAVQWTGDNVREVRAFCASAAFTPVPNDDGMLPQRLTIPTLEGDHRAEPGDWIIRGVKGEFYPCKPDIFAATYEPAQAGPDWRLLAVSLARKIGCLEPDEVGDSCILQDPDGELPRCQVCSILVAYANHEDPAPVAASGESAEVLAGAPEKTSLAAVCSYCDKEIAFNYEREWTDEARKDAALIAIEHIAECPKSPWPAKIAQAVLAEREACARLVEEEDEGPHGQDYQLGDVADFRRRCVATIRARSRTSAAPAAEGAPTSGKKEEP